MGNEELFDRIWGKYNRNGDTLTKENIFSLIKDVNPVYPPVPEWFTEARWKQICMELGARPSDGISREALKNGYIKGGWGLRRDFKRLFDRAFRESNLNPNQEQELSFCTSIKYQPSLVPAFKPRVSGIDPAQVAAAAKKGVQFGNLEAVDEKTDSGARSGKQRVATGFVKRADVDSDSDEDEEDEEEKPEAASVKFAASAEVKEVDAAGEAGGRKAKSRIATGFVKGKPAADDSDEDDDEDGGSGQKVKFAAGADVKEAASAAPGAGRKAKNRIATGFVKGRPADSDDEEDSEDGGAGAKVKFAAGADIEEAATSTETKGKKAKNRIATGFVKGRPQDSDDDEDDEEDDAAGGAKVKFAAGADVTDAASKAEDTKGRKAKSRIATGYVKGKPAPDSDDDDDDEDSDAGGAKVKFAAGADVAEAATAAEETKGKKAKSRIATGFVKGRPEPDSDEEEDSDAGGKVRFAAGADVADAASAADETQGRKAKSRIATGFVKRKPSDDEEDEDEDEDEEDQKVRFAAGADVVDAATTSTGTTRKAKNRIATGYVKKVAADDEDDDDSDGDGDEKAPTAKRGVRIADSPSEDQTAGSGKVKSRVVTGFVRKVEVASDSEDEDEEDDTNQGPCSFRLGKVPQIVMKCQICGEDRKHGRTMSFCQLCNRAVCPSCAEDEPRCTAHKAAA